MRFGVVLGKNGGMLKKLMPSILWGLAGTLGTGKQSISWIHIHDLINAIIFLLENDQFSGCFNLTSPYPVSQTEFIHTLSEIYKRPCFFKTPSFLIKILFGEMGEELLLKGNKIFPKRLLSAGFKFNYPKLKDALFNIKNSNEVRVPMHCRRS